MSTYSCSNCTYSSPTKGLVKKHIECTTKCPGARLIEKIVKVGCEICLKEFDTYKLLEHHQKKCVEKKAVVETVYLNSDDIKEILRVHGDVIKKFENKIISIETELKKLTRQVEKLESKKNEGLELVEQGEEEIFCDHKKQLQFIPLGMKHIEKVFYDNEIDLGVNVDVTIKDQRSYVAEGNLEENSGGIDVDGVIYFYPNSEERIKGRKYTDDLKIIINKFCGNLAVYKKENVGNFCEFHVED